MPGSPERAGAPGGRSQAGAYPGTRLEAYERTRSASPRRPFLPSHEDRTCELVGGQFYDNLQAYEGGHHQAQWLRALAEYAGAAGSVLLPGDPGLVAKLLAPCLQAGVLADMLHGNEPQELIRELYRMRHRARALASSPVDWDEAGEADQSGPSAEAGGSLLTGEGEVDNHAVPVV